MPRISTICVLALVSLKALSATAIPILGVQLNVATDALGLTDAVLAYSQPYSADLLPKDVLQPLFASNSDANPDAKVYDYLCMGAKKGASASSYALVACADRSLIAALEPEYRSYSIDDDDRGEYYYYYEYEYYYNYDTGTERCCGTKDYSKASFDNGAYWYWFGSAIGFSPISAIDMQDPDGYSPGWGEGIADHMNQFGGDCASRLSWEVGGVGEERQESEDAAWRAGCTISPDDTWYKDVWVGSSSPAVLPPTPTPPAGEGACFGDQSTLTVQSQATGPALSKALPDVQIGDKVLTADHRGNFNYKKVVAMRHSKSKAPFIEIEMENPGGSTTAAAKHHLLATEHHTFPLCSSTGKEATAMSLKPGDCLRTTDGRRLIASVEKLPPSASKETYTVVVEGDSELIVVGGVVTRALSKMKALKRLRGTSQKSAELLNADVARITGRYEKSQA